MDHSISAGLRNSIGGFGKVTMPFQSNTFSTWIWVGLSALTIATYTIGETGLAGQSVMLMLLAIALVKGQMVANYFMGLRHTRWLWRIIILAYFLIVGGLIALAYLLGLH